ncbi:MAG TPA: hypothetical protein VF989_05665 [Polyangiaceae bacterium]
MSGHLTRLVDLRRGEGALVLRTTLSLLFVIAGHTLLETARDALFLFELPPSRLALAYAAMGALALVATRVGSAIVSRFGRRSGLVFTLLWAAYGTALFHLIPVSAISVFALYLWSGLIASVVVVQFWMLAGQVFTVGQGKRLFGPIAAGGVFGAVLGAGAAMLCLRWFGVTQLLLVAAAAFVVSALILAGYEVSEEPEARPPRRAGLVQSLSLFKQHRYLPLIAALSVVSSATLLFTDYLFKSVAASQIPAAELGTFFARYYTVLNAAALLAQLFLTGALVRRFGVVAAFAVLPVLLASGALSVAFGGAVFTRVLLTKGADGTLRHSLHRISSELLWMPLAEDVRAQSKALVDTVVVRMTQAAAAGLILVLASRGLDSPRVLGGAIAVLALGWLLLALAARPRYMDLFRQTLQRGTFASELTLDLPSVEVVVEALSSPEPARAIAAIELLAGNGRTGLIPALILYHESEEVLIEALRVLPSRERKDWVPLAKRLLRHESEAVRVAAMRALADAGITSELSDRLYDISPGVRGHAAFLIAHDDFGQPPLEHPAVRDILELQGAAGVRGKVGLLQSIHARGDARWADVVLALSEGCDEKVALALVPAIGVLKDVRFIPFLVRRLSFREGRELVRSALAGLGAPALDELERLLVDPSTDRRLRRHLPRTISRFAEQRAADILTAQLEREPSGLVRYKILRGLGRLVMEAPVGVDRAAMERQVHQNLVEYMRMLALRARVEEGLSPPPAGAEASGRILLGLLDDKRKQALERAFRFLQIAHRHEDIHAVSRAVGSSDRRVRAQALEFLDNLGLDSTVPQNRTLLALVIDDLSPSERLARGSVLLPNPPRSHDEAMLLMLEDEDEVLSSVAAYHALHLDHPELEQIVATLTLERPHLAFLREQPRRISSWSLVPPHAG